MRNTYIKEEKLSFLNEIFSIDFDALLRKIPASIFKSPYHYPVELIRSAIIRGADKIKVKVNEKKLIIEDNGEALSPNSIEALSNLLDPSVKTDKKLEAFSFLENSPDSILYILSPQPRKIIIETSSLDGFLKRMEFSPGQEVTSSEKSEKCDGKGTKIIIFRQSKEIEKEKKGIIDYCQFSRCEIFLNGEKISQKKAIDPFIARIHIHSHDRYGEGYVWIPLEGNMCRIWFLRHGIKHNYSAFPPDEGLIYEAFIESEKYDISNLKKIIHTNALKVYKEIIEKYPQTKSKISLRIEELVFLHFKLTRERTLIEKFSPFEILPDGKKININEIEEMKKVKGAPLHAIRSDEDLSNFAITHEGVLKLQPHQWQFLSEDANIPLTHPLPLPESRSWKLKLELTLKKISSFIFEKIKMLKIKPVLYDKLSPEEKLLLETIKGKIELIKNQNPSDSSLETLELIFSEGKRRKPATIVKNDGKTLLVLFRENSFLKKSLPIVINNPQSITMLLSILTSGKYG